MTAGRKPQTELCQEHAPDRTFRSGRSFRRPADHGAERLCLHWPCLLEGLLGDRRARSHQARGRRLCAEPSQHLEPAFAGPRRSAAARPWPRHVLSTRDGGRAQLLQAAVRLAWRACVRSIRATGRLEWRSSTFPSPRRRARSASCRSKARDFIASGMSADAGPTRRP